MPANQHMTLEAEYVARRPKSAAIAAQAGHILADGVTHDSRHLTPFLPYAVRAQGAYKWDVDGNQYIDLVSGHGALMLGHGRPEVVQAVAEQAARGTHYGMCHELEIEWAELINRLFPSMEEIRFVSSGTEATMMAWRLARAYTNRTRILKFHGHFHGWHDYATVGMAAPFDVPISAGVTKEAASTVISVPAGDIAAVERALDAGDVAAVAVEPTGASMGRVPIGPEFLRQLREVTARRGVLLHFDEVVTGFRVHPGGAQGLWGIRPDLTTLAKVLAGGLPGGAVGGKREVMELIGLKSDPQANRFRRIAHPGTFNANPLSAAAGVACLKIIASGEVHEHTSRLTDRLVAGLREVLSVRDVPGIAYGERSLVHFFLGPDLAPGRMLGARTFPMPVFERAMLVHGVHVFHGSTIILNAALTDADVDKIISAADSSLRRLRQEGQL